MKLSHYIVAMILTLLIAGAAIYIDSNFIRKDECAAFSHEDTAL